MKLFTEAGETANIGVLLYRTALNDSRSKQAILTLRYVFVGLLLGELIAMMIGITFSWTLFAAMGLTVVLAHIVVLLRSLFRKQQVLMEFQPERKAGHFLVNSYQILWVSPMGDVPIFDQHGFAVKKLQTSSGIRYVCTGKTGTAMQHEMQRLMSKERIWKCKTLILEFGPEMEMYPEAAQILDGVQNGRKSNEKAVEI